MAMLLFGYPVVQEHDSERAAWSTFSIQRTLAISKPLQRF